MTKIRYIYLKAYPSNPLTKQAKVWNKFVISHILDVLHGLLFI